MKKIYLLFLVAMSLFIFQACDENKPAGSPEATEERLEERMDDDDAEFITKAASGGMMEVTLGKIAAEKATSPEVKSFGNHMVTDHSKANDELKALAASKNITLPTMLSEDHQKIVDDLSTKTGMDFDKAYMEEMVDDHKEDVENFEEAAKEAKDPDIKAWAAKTVPTLKMHLDMAKTTHEKVKNMK